MDNRPIPTLDDRNARSWRVPNDPSPKAKSRTIPEEEGTPVGGSKTPSTSATKRASKQSNPPPSNFSETSSDAHTDAGSLKNKLRSRMWKLLFNNVDRSVDELYYFCEDENDHQKILDAVHKLRRCLTDFEKLVTRCDEQKRFEEGGQSVSWDVRKTSVGIRRSQIVTTEEFGPIDISGEATHSAENSPTRKGKTYVDLKTPEAKSKLRALAKPFEPTTSGPVVSTARVTAARPVNPIDTDLSDKEAEKKSVSKNDSSAPLYRQECVQMDTSPSASSKPDIREVTVVVGSPPRANHAPSPAIPPSTAPAKSTAVVVASVPAKKPTVLIVPKPPATMTANSFSTPPANRSNTKGGGRNTPSNLGGKTGSDPRSKHVKKPTPTVGYARIRAASESKVTMKPKVEEEDIVVTEEMVKATDAVWAEAEAWIEAEFIAEEIAWKELERAPSTDSIGANLPALKKQDSSTIRQQVSDELDVLHEEEARRKDLNARGDASALAEKLDEAQFRYTTPPPLDQKVPEQVACSGKSLLLPKAGRTVNTKFFEANPSAMDSPAESSSSGHSPNHRFSSLHDKLSSPDRRKLTPAEARQRLDERLLTAESNRTKSVSEIKEKAMAKNTRVKEVSQRTSERLMQAEQSYAAKLRGAEKRHDDYIKNIKDKAGNENTKVSEVLFINSFNEKFFKDELNARLTEVESRILAGRNRKEQLLQGIQDQRRKKNSRKAEQMSELRLNLERQKMERWESLQLRLKTVQDRRQARMEELQRRSVVGPEGNMEPLDIIDTADAIDTGNGLKNEEGIVGSDPLSSQNIEPADGTPILDVLTAEAVGPVMETLLAESPHSKNKKKSKKKNSNVLQDDLDTDAVLDLLAPPEKGNILDADNSEWKMEILSSKLSGADVSGSKQKVSFLSEAARLAATGSMDPFSLSCLAGTSNNGKQAGDAEEKAPFFLKLQAALSFASSTKKKKKKAKATNALSGDVKAISDSAAEANIFEGEHTGAGRPPSNDRNKSVVGRSCLRYQDGGFTSDMIDFIKRGLRIQDTSGLLLQNYSTVEVTSTPNAETVRNFIASGGLLVCVCALHRCTGALHDDKALRLGLEENGSKKTSLALLAAQAIEWCARSDRKNCEKMAQSSELLECLVDFAVILLQSFSSWHSEIEASVSRKNSKNNFSEHCVRTPGKDNSRTNTPLKGPASARKSSSTEGVAGQPNATGGDNGPIDELPEYMSILLPLLSSISSVLAALTDANSGVKLHSTGRSDCSANVTWICYLLQSDLLSAANEALRDVDGYTDLRNGSTNIFHSIIYEIAGLIKEVSRVICGIGTAASLDVSHFDDFNEEKLVHARDSAASYMREEGNYFAANLVQVLSALLLRDLSTITHPVSSDHLHLQRTSAGADKGTGSSSIGSGWDKSQALPPPQVLWSSFRILEALNAVAMVDVLIVQTIPDVLKVSLVHTSSLLLVVLFQIIEDRHWREKPHADPKKIEKKRIVGKAKGRFDEPVKYSRVAGWCPETVGPAEATIGLCPLFFFLGYFCISSLENQAVVARGTPPSLLLRLCRMPIRYLTDERLKHQILPTLIVMCANNPTNMSVLHSELSPTLLTDYLNRLIDKDKASPTGTVATNSSRSMLFTSEKVDDFDPVKELKDRISVSLWPTLVEQLKY